MVQRYVLLSECAEPPGLFVAELPLLQGCRAWGQSKVEALLNLESVVEAHIESLREHNDVMPPQDDLETARYQLYLLRKVEQGLKDVNAGRVAPHEEARRRFAKWLSQ